jgi:hypothetical protein
MSNKSGIERGTLDWVHFSEPLKQYIRRLVTNGTVIRAIIGETAARRFLQLLDVPGSFADMAGRVVKVNDDEDALEFAFADNVIDMGAIDFVVPDGLGDLLVWLTSDSAPASLTLPTASITTEGQKITFFAGSEIPAATCTFAAAAGETLNGATSVTATPATRVFQMYENAWHQVLAVDPPPSIPTTENIQDVVAAMVVGSSQIDIDYDDGAGTLTWGINILSIDSGKLVAATVDDSLTPLTDTNGPYTILSNLANRIKAITGESSWRSNPDSTIAVLNTGMVVLAGRVTDVEDELDARAVATAEVDLGTSACATGGTFDISGLSGLTVGRPVMIQQAPGPYTGKGTMEDEAEMDLVVVTGYVYSATTIRCYWNAIRGPVVGNVKFNYFVS